MDRAGAETWLMHMARGLDPARVRMDFLVHAGRPGAYDAELQRLGCRVLSSPLTRAGLPRYVLRLWRLLRRERYDVVHSHVHLFSGVTLLVARAAGVPVRLAHSHTDASAVEEGASPLRRAYRSLMRALVRREATGGLACSAPAGRDLFGAGWGRDPRWRTLYCGIGLGAFEGACDARALRASLGLAPDELVLGHVGRFIPLKNHAFVVEVARELARLHPRVRLLLVGEGPLQAEVQRQVEASGLGPRTLFLRARPDVPALMRGAMDVLLLPSEREGLPLVGLEAQAAGLPLLVSDAVTPEVAVVPGLVRFLPLARPAADWAAEALALAQRPRPADALARLRQSPFTLEASRAGLEQAYGLAPRAPAPRPARALRPAPPLPA
nr:MULTISPECIES: glycosyltransferase [Myxococcaceae]